MAGTYDRVYVHIDAKGSEDFIPWIESLEENGKGLQDGFFVATFDMTIRSVKPETEEEFLRFLCLSGDLDRFDMQKFLRAPEEGLYELHTQRISQDLSGEVEKAKECIRTYASYKNETCCSKFLTEDDGLEKLFQHWETDILRVGGIKHIASKVDFRKRVRAVQASINGFKSDTSNFKWEASMTGAQRKCQDVECTGPKQGVNDHCVMYGFGEQAPSSRISVTENLRLSRIFNLLWALDHHYPGIQTSFRYYASTHSSFGCHYEDGLFYSANYHFLGHAKVWVIVPPTSTSMLEFHLRRGSHILDASCMNVLGHKRHIPSVPWLKSKNIPFKIVVQKPGDMLIIRPNTPHFGFSTGPCISEAVNFMTVGAIPYLINSKRCLCSNRSPLHINFKHLVAACRPDLHEIQSSGKPVFNQSIVNELKLSCNEICESAYIDKSTSSTSGTDTGSLSCEPDDAGMYGCPVSLCNKKFHKSSNTKKEMKRHVRLAHKPMLHSDCLLQKIDEMFACK